MKKIFELELLGKLIVIAILFSVFSLGVIIGQSNHNNGFLFIVSLLGPFILFGLVGLAAIVTDRS